MITDRWKCALFFHWKYRSVLDIPIGRYFSKYRLVVLFYNTDWSFFSYYTDWSFFFSTLTSCSFFYYEVLLEKKSSALLDAAERIGRRRRHTKVVSTLTVLKGLLLWLPMGAGAIYALLSVVEEELAFHFGGARVGLAAALVCLCRSVLRSILHHHLLRPPITTNTLYCFVL